MYLKLVMRAAFSLKAIYELRKAPLILTLLISLVIGVLHFTPHTLAFTSLEPYMRHVEQMWQLTPDEQQQLLQALPNECRVDNLQLSCDERVTVYINDRVGISVNRDDVEFENGLIFMDDHFIFVGQSGRLRFSNRYLEGIDFGYLQQSAQGYDSLMNRNARALQGVLIFSFIFGSYLTGIVSFFGYIVTVSILAMLLKFGHTSFLKYKEVLNIMIFSAILPSMIVIVVGFIMPAFTILIFNLLTPVVAWFVYKKHVILDLQSPSNEVKEKDFKGVV